MGYPTNFVPYRVILVQMACVLSITSLVPLHNEQLLGGKGITAFALILGIQLRHPLCFEYPGCRDQGRYSRRLSRVNLSVAKGVEVNGYRTTRSHLGRAVQLQRVAGALLYHCLSAVVLTYISKPDEPLSE